MWFRRKRGADPGARASGRTSVATGGRFRRPRAGECLWCAASGARESGRASLAQGGARRTHVRRAQPWGRQRTWTSPRERATHRPPILLASPHASDARPRELSVDGETWPIHIQSCCITSSSRRKADLPHCFRRCARGSSHISEAFFANETDRSSPGTASRIIFICSSYSLRGMRSPTSSETSRRTHRGG